MLCTGEMHLLHQAMLGSKWSTRKEILSMDLEKIPHVGGMFY